MTEGFILDVPFQQGPDGFVHLGSPFHGLWPDEHEMLRWVHREEWEDELHLAVFGGVYSAKTFSGALRQQKYILSWPGATLLIVVPNFPMFEENVRPVIERVNRARDLQEGKDWQFVQQRHVYEYANGCVVYVKSAENPIVGITAAEAWLDEPGKMPYQAYTDTVERVRQEGYPKQTILTGESGGPDHWSTQLFIQDLLTEEEREESEVAFDAEIEGGGRYVYMSARTEDNPHGGKQHAAKLAKLYGKGSALYRRKCLGDPLATTTGLTYEAWDAEYFVVPEERWPTKPGALTELCAGVDFAGVQPCAIEVGGVDSKGRVYVVDEFRKGGMEPESLALEAEKLQRKWPIKYWGGDSAAQEWLRALARRVKPLGAWVGNANKQVGAIDEFSSGIGRVNALLLRRGEQGEQMLFISPKCRWLAREMGTYVRRDDRNPNVKPPSEIPRQVRDDTVDAFRYKVQLMHRLHWLGERVEYDGRTVRTEMRRSA